MVLDPIVVQDIFKACLFDNEVIDKLPDDQAPPGAVVVEGIMIKAAFDPNHLAGFKSKILELLNELPEPFMKDKGGGYSFLAAYEDKHGHHWAEHSTMDILFILGMAIGAARPCLPREFWYALPSGMPYYVVDTNPEKLVPWVKDEHGEYPVDEDTKKFIQEAKEKLAAVASMETDPGPSIH